MPRNIETVACETVLGDKHATKQQQARPHRTLATANLQCNRGNLQQAQRHTSNPQQHVFDD